MDKLTPQQRRKNMQSVKNKDSKIERILAHSLWTKGYRYRKNNKSVFGKPDLTFAKYKVAIFVDSEFWHGKDWETHKTHFDTNSDFWTNKIQKNISRDRDVNQHLANEGWIVLRFWGKVIEKKVDECVEEIERYILRK